MKFRFKLAEQAKIHNKSLLAISKELGMDDPSIYRSNNKLATQLHGAMVDRYMKYFGLTDIHDLVEFIPDEELVASKR